VGGNVSRPAAPDLLPALASRQVGARLRERRTARGLSVYAAAAKAGVGPPYLSAVERGARRVQAGHLPALAAAVGMDAADLMTSRPGAAGTRAVAWVRSFRDIAANCICDWAMVFRDRRPAGWELARAKPGCLHHGDGARA
jgi:transcriptional regulator with XRE-family HTH domain